MLGLEKKSKIHYYSRIRETSAFFRSLGLFASVISTLDSANVESLLIIIAQEITR